MGFSINKKTMGYLSKKDACVLKGVRHTYCNCAPTRAELDGRKTWFEAASLFLRIPVKVETDYEQLGLIVTYRNHKDAYEFYERALELESELESMGEWLKAHPGQSLPDAKIAEHHIQ